MGKYILLDASGEKPETLLSAIDSWLSCGGSCPILSNYERFEPDHRTFTVLTGGALLEIRQLKGAPPEKLNAADT